MKKIILVTIVVLLALAGIAHTAWYYFHIKNDAFTSLPANIAFLLIIPYALAIFICLAIGFIISRKKAS